VDTPIRHTSQSQTAQENRGDSRPSPIRGSFRRQPNSRNSGLPALLISPLSKFDQLPRTLGALQDMQVFWVGEIQFLGRVHPHFQGGMVDTANALRIRVFFEDVLLKLLKEQRIIVIILEKRLTLVH
jgi:hypothetical protein